MDMEEAIRIAGCVQVLPQYVHATICDALNASRLGYVFSAVALGEVTVKMTPSAQLAYRKLQSVITRTEAG